MYQFELFHTAGEKAEQKQYNFLLTGGRDGRKTVLRSLCYVLQ